MMVRFTLLSFLLLCSVAIAQSESRITIDLYGNAKTAGETIKIIFNKTDETGRINYSVAKDIPYDVPFPSAKLFDNGSMVIADAFSARLEFYGNNGDLVNTYNFYKENNVAYERTLFIHTSGFSVAAVLSEPGIKTKLALIDISGNEYLSYELEEESVTGLLFNESLKLTIISTQQWLDDQLINSTNFMDFTGNEITSFNFGFTYGKFIDVKELVVYEQNSVHLIDLNNYSLSTSIAFNDQIVLDCEKVDEEILVLGGNNVKLDNGKWKYKVLEFSKFDPDGNLISQKSFNNISFESVKIKTDGGIPYIMADGKQIKIN